MTHFHPIIGAHSRAPAMARSILVTSAVIMMWAFLPIPSLLDKVLEAIGASNDSRS